MKESTLIIGIILALTINVTATTWSPSEHVCPICKKENTYQVIRSYGNYIYGWPSKYQYVYWPLTDSPSVYCCTVCHFATYMWDFDSIPDNKIDTIKIYLAKVILDEKYEDYLDIKMTTRLEIAEHIYKILGRDSEFWCKFYRVLGYHYSKEQEKDKAFQSRRKALNLAKTMLNDTSYLGHEKENFFIIAAMYNFTEHKDSALAYLDKASAFTYNNKSWKDENVKGLDKYLTDLIIQYKEFIKKGEEKE